MRINFKIVLKVLGLLMCIMGLFMLLPCMLIFLYPSVSIEPFVIASLCSLVMGFFLFQIKVATKEIKKREGYLIVGLGWIVLCIFGALPYCLDGNTGLQWSEAFFESSSGLTTTGATVFSDIEALEPTILLWRSLTQWIGGMGIIVFTIAIFPILGIGGVELFVAESPGPTTSKIHPRIAEVAKRLWLIYIGLTMALFLILHYFGKMNWFDAINHAMTTISTGGFSTKNASIAFYNSPLIEYTIIVFMLISGMNFTLLYYLFKFQFKRVWSSDELKIYLTFLSAVLIFISAILIANHFYGIEESIRVTAFQLVSLVTTTGFITADYTSWTPGLELIFFMLLFVGACAGSTSGGIKMIRHLVFFKTAILEYKRILNPREYIRMKIDGEVVPSRILTHILVFLLFYLILFAVGVILTSMLLSNDAEPFKTAAGAVATCLGNVGPGIGSVGPVNNFSGLPCSLNVFLSIYMIIGRLEIFTILILLTPFFWRIK